MIGPKNSVATSITVYINVYINVRNITVRLNFSTGYIDGVQYKLPEIILRASV